MKYKIIFAIDADAESDDEFLDNLNEYSHIIQEEMGYYVNGYNKDAGGEEDIDVWVNCEQISEEEYCEIVRMY